MTERNDTPDSVAGPRTIPRPRLLEHLGRSKGALITGPSGSGKSTLALDWARTLGLPVLLVNLADAPSEPESLFAELAAAAGRARLRDSERRLRTTTSAPELLEALADRRDGVLLVLDEVQVIASETALIVRDLAVDLAPQHHVAFVGHRAPEPLSQIAEFVRVGADDLRCSVSEIEAILARGGREPEPEEVAHVARHTDGWTMAVVLASGDRSSLSAFDGENPEAAVERIVRSMLDRLTDLDRQAAVAVAPLARFSEAELELLAGTGTIDRLFDAGLPLSRFDDGWYTFADPVRSVIAAASRTDIGVSRTIAASLARHGAITIALRQLVDVGDDDGAAGLLAASDWRDLVPVGAAELIITFEAFPDAVVRSNPLAAVAIGRALEDSGRLDLRARVLSRAVETLGFNLETGADESGMAARSDAERRLYSEWLESIAYGADYASARRPALDLLSTLDNGEFVTRARLLWTLARADARDGTPEQMRNAEDRFATAATLFARAGEPELAAGALTALGYNVRFARGDLDGALDALRNARGLLHPTVGARAGSATFLAEIQAWRGDFDDAERALREADEVARILGDRRTRGFVAWDLALISSLRGDEAMNEEYLRAAESHYGEWVEHPMGVVFLSDSAEMRARLGDEPGARHRLTRALDRAREVGLPEIALRAVGAVEARFGDPAVAHDALDRFERSPECLERDRWRLSMFRALACRRLHDADQCRRHLHVAESLVAAMGAPELLDRFEHDVMELLRADPATGGTDAGPTRFSVGLFGEFVVRVDGRTVPIAQGHPTQILKILAIAGRAVNVEQLVDHIWPDLDLFAARERLRRTLYRLNRHGEIVRRAGESLMLAVDAVVDLHEFERVALAAIEAEGAARVDLARQALTHYLGELLPVDRYEDWAVAPRERSRRRFLALSDIVVSDAVGRGELDEAIRRLDAAIEAEPLDDTRLLLCAELLVQQGHTGSARRLVERAADVATELGLSPTLKLRELAGSLGIDLS